LAEGSTNNTSVVTDLLTGLRDRGLDTSQAVLVGIEGGKALRAAVLRVFDHPVIQRCQLHKIRNVADKLPDRLASTVTSRMRAAYQAESALAAEAQLQALAKVLERTHPGAAGSVREGLAETLTVLRLSVRGTDRGNGPGVSRAQRGAAFMTRPPPSGHTASPRCHLGQSEIVW